MASRAFPVLVKSSVTPPSLIEVGFGLFLLAEIESGRFGVRFGDFTRRVEGEDLWSDGELGVGMPGIQEGEGCMSGS